MTPAHVLHRRCASLGDDLADPRLGLLVAQLRGQEAFDDRDFAFFGGSAVLAIALAVDLGRFAALLDHLLQDFGDERIVVGGSAASTQPRYRGS